MVSSSTTLLKDTYTLTNNSFLFYFCSRISSVDFSSLAYKTKANTSHGVSVFLKPGSGKEIQNQFRHTILPDYVRERCYAPKLRVPNPKEIEIKQKQESK